MFDPYKRLASLVAGKGAISSQKLRFFEMMVANEIVLDTDQNLDNSSRTFIRKVLGLKLVDFQTLCPTDDAVRAVLAFRVA